MPLSNLGNSVTAIAGASLPTIAFAGPVTQAEGASGSTAFTFTLNLTRNGSAAAIPFTWAVAGSGANPAVASDFVGGALPSGAGAFAANETSKAIVVNVAGDSSFETDEAFTVTAQASMPLASASATGTILNDDVAPPPSLLMGSRLNQPGFGGYAGSDGTDTDSNSRIGSYNETGTGVVKMRTYDASWMANGSNEQNGYNAVTIKRSLEWPAGVFTPVTWSGSTSLVTNPAQVTPYESDEVIPATPVTAGALHWWVTWVQVAPGGKWVQSYLINTLLGETVDFSTGVDKTAGGTITNAAPATTRRGYGPAAVKATGFTGAPVAKAFAAVGDSIVMGAADAQDTLAAGHGNIGYFSKACANNYPCINLGIAGTNAQLNQPANFTRRNALLAKIGITHIFCNWSVNDISAGRTAAQLAGDVANIAAGFKSAVAGIKVVWSTLTPRSNSTDAWKTVANQTPFPTPAGAYTGGASSQRSQFNALLRSGISGVDVVFDAADVAEPARDSGVWKAGGGSVHLTSTGANSDAMVDDGLHLRIWTQSSSTALGGTYVMIDGVRAVFATW